jgi:hypothetical protein
MTTDGQSASLSCYKAPIRGLRSDFYFRTEYGIRLTVTFLIPWGALSHERTGLIFVCAAGPCHRSLSRVLVSWDLRPYFTLSDLRLPFSSPPTTRRVTVEVFDPASTRVNLSKARINSLLYLPRVRDRSHYVEQLVVLCYPVGCHGNLVFSNLLPGSDSFVVIRRKGNVISDPLLSSGCLFRLHHSGFQSSCHTMEEYWYKGCSLN